MGTKLRRGVWRRGRRHQRYGAGITPAQQEAGNHSRRDFNLWPNDISRLERGLKRDDTLATAYRHWLSTQAVAI